MPATTFDPALLAAGTWSGFFLDSRAPGQHAMAVALAFDRGRVLGGGRDDVGAFTIEGRYTAESGECVWTKRYESHDVLYRGFAESGSIWGTWRIRDSAVRGGFQLWPAPADPSPEANVDRARERAKGVGRDL